LYVQANSTEKELLLEKLKTTDCSKFQELFDKPVFASFDRETESSDGGALLIKAADTKLNLTERLSKSIRERH
jgi:hypothetical protein